MARMGDPMTKINDSFFKVLYSIFYFAVDCISENSFNWYQAEVGKLSSDFLLLFLD